MVAPAASASGRTLFGKNSDRHPNEAQYPIVVPAADHEPGTEVLCTYVSIPQIAHTYRVFGSRPWWLWGFEHGVNEHGLAIGNEALWSKFPGRMEPGLIGMDLLRLTLERAATADEALHVLTGLIETYGQSGPTNSVLEETYENGFVIADPTSAWLVQTADRHWVAKRVETVGSMSNVYSIGSDYTRISEGAIAAAVANGWFDPAGDTVFDFAEAFGDPELPDIDGCRSRYARSGALLDGLFASSSGITLQDIHGVLCDLGVGPSGSRRPGPRSEQAICMHAQDTRGSETEATLIAELDVAETHTRVGVSAAAPRYSTLIPVWADGDVVPGWEQPVAAAEPDVWWETEELQRRIEAAYPALAPIAEAAFARANRVFFAENDGLASADLDSRMAATARGSARHRAVIRGLVRLFDEIEPHVVGASDADLRGTYLDDIEQIREPTHVDGIAAARIAALGWKN